MFSGFSRTRQISIFLLYLLCSIFFFQIYPHFVFTNEHSRLLLASAIVEDGSVEIDHAIRRFGNTQDKAVFNGRFYSDKAVGTSIFAIPFYAAAKAIGIQQDTASYIFWLKIFCVTIPSICFVIFLWSFWDRSFNGNWNRFLAFVFAFGTIYFPYSLQYISHNLTGIALFLSFYFAYSAHHQASNSKLKIFLCGLFAGFAAILEYPAIIQSGLIFLYCLLRSQLTRRLAYLYVAGIVPMILIMLGYNYIIFNDPFDVTYRHMSDQIHAAQHGEGMIGLRLPEAGALFGLLISPARGLFFFSPILLFSIPGLYLLIRNPRWRAEGILFFVIVLSSLFFHSGMSNWDGGWSIGPRYLVPILPFLMTATAFFAAQKLNVGALKFNFVFYFFGLVSVFFFTVGTITFPFPAPDIPNPIFSLFIPLFLKGAYPKNLPEIFGIGGPLIGILFYVLLFITFLTFTVPKKDVHFDGFKSRYSLAAILCFVLLIFGGVKFTSSKDAFHRYSLGTMYFCLGKCSDALSELRDALNENPGPELRQWIIGRAWQVKEVCESRKSSGQLSN